MTMFELVLTAIYGTLDDNSSLVVRGKVLMVTVKEESFVDVVG